MESSGCVVLNPCRGRVTCLLPAQILVRHLGLPFWFLIHPEDATLPAPWSVLSYVIQTAIFGTNIWT